MIWINAVLGMLGGATRACVGLLKAMRSKTKIKWSKVLFTIITSAIIGATTGLIFDSDYKISLIAGYIGTDLLENTIKIIAKKDINGVNVLVNLRTLIATEFNYAFEPKGAESKIINTSSELDAYRYSSNSGEREAAFLAQLGKYEQNLDKFFSIYQAVVKDWNDEVKWRGFSSPISMRNHENNIPDKAIETLLEACSENVEVFQNHFKWKAGQLGVDKLRRFDIYALLEKENVKVPFNKAVKMVLETLNNFSPPFAEKAKMIVDANHIDSHPDEVKEGGAFAASMTPDIIPYIFLNHNDTPRDVSVLAHELGHGIHFLYSSNHSIKSHNAPLPLAETASTFSEMIMFEELLKNAPNDFARKSMLSEKMDESYATVMRQNYFVKFEIEAHRAIPQGITAKQLSDIYFKTLEEQFGDSLDIDPIFRYEWANIPHIVHTPFYCYAYNFGELLSLSLFSRYKNEGRSFIPKIEKILSYGGSENPQKILNEIGVDINSKEFWQGSFDIIKNWQKKLEKY